MRKEVETIRTTLTKIGSKPVRISSYRHNKKLLKIKTWYSTTTFTRLQKHLIATELVEDVYTVPSINGTINTIIRLK